jgi:hypothetical protein
MAGHITAWARKVRTVLARQHGGKRSHDTGRLRLWLQGMHSLTTFHWDDGGSGM